MKTALVTGATGGIGSALTAAFTQKEVMATLNTLGDKSGIQSYLPF